jgi:hypothetical protein
MSTEHNLSVSECWELAFQARVVKRGLRFAAVVGVILIGINHGDAILRGELHRSAYLKMILTAVVPYVVSVLSSIGAMRENSSEGLG